MKHLRPVLTAFLFSAISWSALASAEPNDAAASKLAEQAIFEDYLNLDYPSAEKKLTDALAKCQKGCSAKVKGDISRERDD